MRNKILVTGFVLSALLSACTSSGPREAPAAPEPAAVAQPAQAEPAASPVETAKVDRTVCKSVAPTGTRIAKKVCRTQSEWEEMARAGREAADTVKRRGAQSVLPSN
jgi:cytochrome c5